MSDTECALRGRARGLICIPITKEARGDERCNSSGGVLIICKRGEETEALLERGREESGLLSRTLAAVGVMGDESS